MTSTQSYAGYVVARPPLPQPIMSIIPLDEARGERLVRVSDELYDTLVLVFETGYVLLRAKHTDDASGDYTQIVAPKWVSAEDLSALVRAKLLTHEQETEYRKEALRLAHESGRENRRAMYEQLKKEFEGT